MLSIGLDRDAAVFARGGWSIELAAGTASILCKQVKIGRVRQSIMLFDLSVTSNQSIGSTGHSVVEAIVCPSGKRQRCLSASPIDAAHVSCESKVDALPHASVAGLSLT